MLKKTVKDVETEFRKNNPDIDYYDFSKAEVEGPYINNVFCKKHNEFFRVKKYNFVNGQKACTGCKEEQRNLRIAEIQRKKQERLSELMQKNYSDYDFEIIGNTVIRKDTKIKLINKQTKEIKYINLIDIPDSQDLYGEMSKDPEKDIIELINKNFPNIDTSKVVYKGYTSDIILRCKIHGNEFTMKPTCIKEAIRLGRTELCSLCKENARTIELTKWFVDEYNKRYPDNHFDLSKTIYRGMHHTITVYCKLHKIYFTCRPYEFLYEETGCQFCAQEKRNETIRKEKEKILLDYLHENYLDIDTSLVNYINTFTPVLLKCKKHPDEPPFEVIPWVVKSVMIQYRKNYEICPICHREFEGQIKSMLERDVEKVLDTLKIPYTREKMISKENLNSINLDSKFIKVDFEFNYNGNDYIIETNGKQHYMPTYHFHKTKERYERQLIRDSCLKDYCINNNIVFIEIPYTYNTYNKIYNVLDEILLNNKDPKDIIEYPEIVDPIYFDNTKI